MISSFIIAWIPALTLVLAVTLQESVIPLEAWSVFRPDLVLICLFYWRLYRPDRCTVTLAFLIGLLVDTVSGTALGLNTFSKTLLVLLVSRFGQRLRSLEFYHMLFGIVAVSLLDAVVQLLLMGLVQGVYVRWPLLLGRPVATLLIAPLCFSLLIYIHHWWLENV
ncbi:MAG: rod shape-determining protein MreD [Magnetococcales bacterium]|nr:rod shape-determining protein MreD [Magnetococcales bacterium]MBF0583650.1 rod shape-determining protein MreD [Magnetococcales bacterium]